MSNQVSDDELREKIDDVLSHFEVTVPNLDEVGLYDLVHPRIKDKYGNGVEWGIVINDEIMQLIRTEKLKTKIDLLKTIRRSYPKRRTLQGNAQSKLTLADIDRLIGETKMEAEL